MNENQNQQVEPETQTENVEPQVGDNSTISSSEESKDLAKSKEDKSLNPSEDLILGKFKTVEDLTKAYGELEKHQGECSAELGSLRHELASMKALRDNLEKIQSIQGKLMPMIAEAKEKYNTPEYFQDPSFRELYGEALMALGENLDCDRLVNLIESYVTARIFAHERNSAAKMETQQVLDSMSYDKNPKSSVSKPKKSLDEMTEAEVDEMLDRLL